MRGTAGTLLESGGLALAPAVWVVAGGLLVVVGLLKVVAAAVVGGAPAAGSTAAGRPAVDMRLASWELVPSVAAVVVATSLEVGVVVQIF